MNCMMRRTADNRRPLRLIASGPYAVVGPTARLSASAGRSRAAGGTQAPWVSGVRARRRDTPRVNDIVTELEALIRSDVIARMGGDASGELTALTLDSLIISYLNWRARFIPRRPRQVHLSHELLASAKYQEHCTAIDAIAAKTAAGDDLAPHLSRGTRTAYQPTSSRRRRRADLDGLIAEWNIHHLHVTTTVEPDGYVTRTDDLLFAHFAEVDAYFIGVFPHGAWARSEIAEIVMRNWRDARIFVPLQGGLRLAQIISDGDRQALRDAGVTTLLEVDGQVCVPAGSGQSTARTPMWATEQANALMHALRQLRGAELPTSTLVVDKDGDKFRVRDTTSGTVVWQVLIAR